MITSVNQWFISINVKSVITCVMFKHEIKDLLQTFPNRKTLIQKNNFYRLSLKILF